MKSLQSQHIPEQQNMRERLDILTREQLGETVHILNQQYIGKTL